MASDSFSLALLSRVEDAGLNASAPPQQRWLDGWLVRYLPGKARRARCINALAPGLLPLAHKLAMAEPVYAEAGLPMIFRLTRFTQPPGLDDELQRLGFAQVDPTLVMIRPDLPALAAAASRPLPPGTRWTALDGPAYAEAVGTLRGSPPEHRSSHALRLQHSPVPYQGFAIVRQDDATVLACGQFAREGELVGLYDVHTHESARGQGLAGLLCERMLTISASRGAKTGYLQVDGANHPALAVYRRLGFAPGYGYHYRERPQA
jgi:ribosomal protein S18 acetylase RimI-like enzyme